MALWDHDMTARKRLPSAAEIRAAGDLAIEIMGKAVDKGLDVGGVAVRADGVTLLPKGESQLGDDFAEWKAQDAGGH